MWIVTLIFVALVVSYIWWLYRPIKFSVDLWKELEKYKHNPSCYPGGAVLYVREVFEIAVAGHLPARDVFKRYLLNSDDAAVKRQAFTLSNRVNDYKHLAWLEDDLSAFVANQENIFIVGTQPKKRDTLMSKTT